MELTDDEMPVPKAAKAKDHKKKSKKRARLEQESEGALDLDGLNDEDIKNMDIDKIEAELAKYDIPADQLEVEDPEEQIV